MTCFKLYYEGRCDIMGLKNHLQVASTCFFLGVFFLRSLDHPPASGDNVLNVNQIPVSVMFS